ncbi:hypothetical protein EVAR_25283_1 [Eumeta japonica]|uniref:Uncharacterized protein n=1 Tax=Eumeta variegata TaxID=151549 RepID=A0A4C1VP44_EUMVA|nr:hypothetical protein EVAR_25283_1 [Eumeta japonica]
MNIQLIIIFYASNYEFIHSLRRLWLPPNGRDAIHRLNRGPHSLSVFADARALDVQRCNKRDFCLHLLQYGNRDFDSNEIRRRANVVTLLEYRASTDLPFFNNPLLRLAATLCWGDSAPDQNKEAQ